MKYQRTKTMKSDYQYDDEKEITRVLEANGFEPYATVPQSVPSHLRIELPHETHVLFYRTGRFSVGGRKKDEVEHILNKDCRARAAARRKGSRRPCRTPGPAAPINSKENGDS